MGMSIEEAIKDIELTCEYLKNIGVFDNPANEKCKPSLVMAKDIMRKYQKIQEIYQWAKERSYIIEADDIMNKLSEVIE